MVVIDLTEKMSEEYYNDATEKWKHLNCYFLEISRFVTEYASGHGIAQSCINSHDLVIVKELRAKILADVIQMPLSKKRLVHKYLSWTLCARNAIAHLALPLIKNLWPNYIEGFLGLCEMLGNEELATKMREKKEEMEKLYQSYNCISLLELNDVHHHYENPKVS